MRINIRVTPDADEALGAVEVPRAFMLIGEGGPNVLCPGQVGDVPWVVDAEGVRLRGGAVYAWCYAGCCESPRCWPSVEAAADFHGSVILPGDGIVRVPRDEASREAVPGDDAVPGDVPGAG